MSEKKDIFKVLWFYVKKYETLINEPKFSWLEQIWAKYFRVDLSQAIFKQPIFWQH